MGRPELMASIGAIEGEMILRMAEILRAPQERGWIRPDLDLQALCAWLMGSPLSRVVVDFGGSSVSDEAWRRIAELAFVTIIFGDESVPVEDRLTA
jgi:hypothetical protein